MPDVDLEKQLAVQAEQIDRLRQQLEAVLPLVPKAPHVALTDGPQWPIHVYKCVKLNPNKPQLDHPGSKTKLVRSPAELKAAEADGWKKEVPLPEYLPDPSEAPTQTPNARAATARDRSTGGQAWSPDDRRDPSDAAPDRPTTAPFTPDTPRKVKATS